MVLYFIQFGIALNMGQCGKQEDDHGFSSASTGRFSSNVLEEYFTLDIEKMTKRQLDSNPFTDYFAKVFSVFGQDDSDSQSVDTMGLLGALGVMGA